MVRCDRKVDLEQLGLGLEEVECRAASEVRQQQLEIMQVVFVNYSIDGEQTFVQYASQSLRG